LSPRFSITHTYASFLTTGCPAGSGHGVTSLAHDDSRQPSGTTAQLPLGSSATSMRLPPVMPGGHSISRGGAGGFVAGPRAKHFMFCISTDHVVANALGSFGLSLPLEHAATERITGAANEVRRRNALMNPF